MRKRPKLTEQGFDKFAAQLKEWIAESVSPFEDDTPEKQAERKRRGREDLLYFCKTYLPHYFPVDFGEFHEEWEDLSELRDEVALVAAPREHAKSTFWSFAVPVRNIVYALRRFQLVVSDTNDQAKGFTLAIRAELRRRGIDIDAVAVRPHILEQAVCHLRRGRALNRLVVRLFGHGLQAGNRQQADAEHDQRDQQFEQREAVDLVT